MIRSRGRCQRGGYDADDGHEGAPGAARRQFTDEFKAGAVRLVLDEGKSVAEVARDPELTPSALSGWVRQARANRDGGKSGLTTEERAELAALRNENRQLRVERVLKKAVGSST